MFLYINIELVCKQPIEKCLTLSFCWITKVSLFIDDKYITIPAKSIKTVYFYFTELKKGPNIIIMLKFAEMKDLFSWGVCWVFKNRYNHLLNSF